MLVSNSTASKCLIAKFQLNQICRFDIIHALEVVQSIDLDDKINKRLKECLLKVLNLFYFKWISFFYQFT